MILWQFTHIWPNFPAFPSCFIKGGQTVTLRGKDKKGNKITTDIFTNCHSDLEILTVKKMARFTQEEVLYLMITISVLLLLNNLAVLTGLFIWGWTYRVLTFKSPVGF